MSLQENDVEVDDIYYDDDSSYYYQSNEDEFLEIYLENNIEKTKKNLEFFDYECITQEQAKQYFDSVIQNVSQKLKLLPSISKILLINGKWNENEIVANFESNMDLFLESIQIKPLDKIMKINETSVDFKSSNINSLEELSYTKYTNNNLYNLTINLANKLLCDICLQSFFINSHKSLICEHYYCQDCWKNYLKIHISNGDATNIECMSSNCNILVPEDFIDLFFSNTLIKEKYDELSFRDCVNSNIYMRPCIGPNCSTIIRAKEFKAKRVICNNCNSCYCFKCGCEYHAPSDCKTIKLWITKCEDDSETANYISAHTKDCPECGSCIEKNGGCNHMKCYSCKFEFCWMCLGSWKTHGSQFYECSKYKENPNIINESEKAREALKKYLFYYERWDNHKRSLRLEDRTLKRISEKINEKVMSNSGTWIDWQYLLDAAALLAKCRYTLQYTYPYAYFMETGARKSLLEYQQAQLEAEIENLSWKIEHAESTDRGDLENQMDIVEKRRTTVLEDFLNLT